MRTILLTAKVTSRKPTVLEHKAGKCASNSTRSVYQTLDLCYVTSIRLAADDLSVMKWNEMEKVFSYHFSALGLCCNEVAWPGSVPSLAMAGNSQQPADEPDE